jgi:DNA-binding MarR family transcriptional regulator
LGAWSARVLEETDMTTAERTFRTLLRTIGSLRRVMEPYFAGFGISGPQWAVLRNLHRAEEEEKKDLSLRELGDRLLIRPPSVTGVVDRLERLGLVARSQTGDDRRVRRVRLTPAGHALVKRILAVHAKQVQAVMSGLSQREQVELRALLERLETRLRAMSGGAGEPPTRGRESPRQ